MEEASVDNVPSERTADTDSLPSASIPMMEQATVDNVPCERTVERGRQISESLPMRVQLYEGDVMQGIGFCRPPSVEIQRLEAQGDDINHDHYRFAYQLVEKVLMIRKELNPFVPHNLPEPSNYLFTEAQAKFIERFLESDAVFLSRRIHKFSQGIHDPVTYLNIRDFLVKEWGDPANMPEKSFIAACATIAYLAAFYTQMNYHCGALDDVVVYIANWSETIDRTDWRPN